MNRRWRRLLASGLIGAVLSMLVERGRKRIKTADRRPFQAWMRPILSSLLGGMNKEAWWWRLLPVRRRIR